MRIILLVLISFISIAFSPNIAAGQGQLVDSQPITKLENLSLEARLKAIEEESSKLKDASYVGLLEKNNAILESANSALAQRWTPLTVMLTALTAIYALITVAWGVIFAFGYRAYKNTQKYEEEMKERLSIIKKEQEIINFTKNEAVELSSQLKTKKKDAAEIEIELRDIVDKSERALKKLEEESYLVTMGSSGTTSVVVGASPFVLRSTSLGYRSSRAKTCSRCGAIFADSEDQIRGDAYSAIPIVDRLGYSTEDILCPRCKGTIK